MKHKNTLEVIGSFIADALMYVLRKTLLVLHIRCRVAAALRNGILASIDRGPEFVTYHYPALRQEEPTARDFHLTVLTCTSIHDSQSYLEQEVLTFLRLAAVVTTSKLALTSKQRLIPILQNVQHFETGAGKFMKTHDPYTHFLAVCTMTTFFVQWALWEKMTFCLALTIVSAILLGFVKNMYSRWRLRNYSTIEERLLDPTPAMIEARIANKINAPFGIRALESGVEIEGVWISRTNLNTPTPSRPQSPAASSSSSYLDEPTTPSFAIIEGAKPRIRSTQSSVPSWYAHSKRSSDAGSAASWTIDSNGFKQIEAQKPRPMSSPTSGGLHRSTASTSSAMSHSTLLDFRRTLTVSSESDEIRRFLPSSTTATSLATSVNGSEESKTSHEDAEFVHRPIESGKEKKADLCLLHTHRLSHVAETGQLVPRNKKSSQTSVDLMRTAPSRAPRPCYPPISMHNRRMSKSLPSTPTKDVQNPFEFATPAHHVGIGNPPEMAAAKAEGSTTKVVPSDASSYEHETDLMIPGNFYENNTGVISAIATLSKPEAVHAPSLLEHHRGREVLRSINDNSQITKPHPITDAVATTAARRASSRDRIKRHLTRLPKQRPSRNEHNRNSFIEVLYGSERHSR